MADQKHTPGPWTARNLQAETYKSSACRELGRQKGFYICGPKDASDFVADVFFSSHDLGEAEANARLIAAAPDLLEACELMYAAWKELMPNLKQGVVQDYELVCTTAPVAATKAIAKATGQKVTA